jgi:predicted SAM-dependent methyltransferase
VSIPVEAGSVNVIYSDQLMEHLHPEDAIEQLQNIYNALAPGGVYICHTPNQLSGSHDVSGCYDEIATGFHLHEYLVTELYALFKKIGFSQISYYKSTEKLQIKIPLTSITRNIFQLGENFTIAVSVFFKKKNSEVINNF